MVSDQYRHLVAEWKAKNTLVAPHQVERIEQAGIRLLKAFENPYYILNYYMNIEHSKGTKGFETIPNLQADTHLEIIGSWYRRVSMKYHPDTSQGIDVAHYELINNAYAKLADKGSSGLQGEDKTNKDTQP